MYATLNSTSLSALYLCPFVIPRVLERVKRTVKEGARSQMLSRAFSWIGASGVCSRLEKVYYFFVYFLYLVDHRPVPFATEIKRSEDAQRKLPF